MSKLVIRKRVDLDFLGEEYKEAHITFRSIPVGNYDAILADIKTVGEDNSKANSAILKILKDNYLDSLFPNEKGELEPLESVGELDGLDKDALLECFGKLIGQDLKAATEQGVQTDPKSDTPSKPGSTVESLPQ